MFEKKWVRWLLVFIALIFVGQGAAFLLAKQGFPRAGLWLGLGDLALSYLWLSIGLFAWRKTPWVWWAGLIIHGTVGLFILTGVLYFYGFPRVAISSFSIWCMAAAFLVGFWFIRLILSPGYPIFGVARTVVDEAIGLRVVLVPIIMMIGTVCILPVVLDPAERLEYRIQTFLSWATSCTGFLLSAMTVFLACSTVCNEIQNKQIYLTMTKPVGRFQYIVGKWLGITLINVVLIVVMGLGIYNFTRLLEMQFAVSQDDRFIVEKRVLVARQAVNPIPVEGFEPLYQAQLSRLRAEDENTYGPNMTKETERMVREQVAAGWYNISPSGIGPFKFVGLDKAKNYGDVIQLRLKADTSPRPPDETMDLLMVVNGRPWPMGPNGQPQGLRLICNQFQIIDLPVQAIDSHGELVVVFKNMTIAESGGQPHPVGIGFTKGEGLQVLYRVGSFDTNLARSMLMLWFRLVFLAMAGIMAGTFLGFPVACMLSIMIFLVSTCSSFFNESLNNYVAIRPDTAYYGNDLFAFFVTLKQNLFDKPDYYKVVKMGVRLFGQFFVFLVPAFADFDPIPFLVDGREIPMQMVWDGLLKMATIWTVACLVIGWLVFRVKELARVII